MGIICMDVYKYMNVYQKGFDIKELNNQMYKMIYSVVIIQFLFLVIIVFVEWGFKCSSYGGRDGIVFIKVNLGIVIAECVIF